MATPPSSSSGAPPAGALSHGSPGSTSSGSPGTAASTSGAGVPGPAVPPAPALGPGASGIVAPPAPAAILTFRDALDATEAVRSKPLDGSKNQEDKRLYATELSRNIAQLFANRLRGFRSDFETVLPDETGAFQESPAASASGPKKLDVNFSTPQLGLGLGISIKTINFRDMEKKSVLFGHNFSRYDTELRAEATDYHLRQPYSVLVAVVFMPMRAFYDWEQRANGRPCSFASAVEFFTPRCVRRDPKDEPDRFELFYIGVYRRTGPKNRGADLYFNVRTEPHPPKRGRPAQGLITFDEMMREIVAAYDARNTPPFVFSPDPKKIVFRKKRRRAARGMKAVGGPGGLPAAGPAAGGGAPGTPSGAPLAPGPSPVGATPPLRGTPSSPSGGGGSGSSSTGGP